MDNDFPAITYVRELDRTGILIQAQPSRCNTKENWRAIQNKTANAYVIEIQME